MAIDLKMVEEERKTFKDMTAQEKERVYNTADKNNSNRQNIFWLGLGVFGMFAFVSSGGFIGSVAKGLLGNTLDLTLMIIMIVAALCFLVGLTFFRKLNHLKSGVPGDRWS